MRPYFDVPPVFVDRAFEGEGVSVYASAGTEVKYRSGQCVNGLIVMGSKGSKYTQSPATLRIAKVAYPGTSLNWTIPAELLPSTGQTAFITFDVRHYKADVENLTTNYNTQTIEIDDTGGLLQAIMGTGKVTSQEQRTGGIVRIFFNYIPKSGQNPDKFRLIRTSGPSSPADQTIPYSNGQRSYRFETTALLDSGPYGFTIRAENSDGSIWKDLVISLSVTADASGPPAATSVETEVV